MGITLRSLKTYEYIGSKTKSYRTKRISSTIYLSTLQTLAFRPHAFRLFLSSMKTQFAQVLDLRICPNNLNRTTFAKSFASHSILKLSGSTRVTSFSSYCITATGAIHLPESRTRCVQLAILSLPAWQFYRPRALCGSKTLPRHIASHRLGWKMDR